MGRSQMPIRGISIISCWKSWGIWLLALTALGAVMLTMTWRTWCDPMVDFGHQLYFPWQYAEGRLLYRDIACIMGPLSQMVHGALFRLLGPSYLWIIVSNCLVVSCVTVGLFLLGAMQQVRTRYWIGSLLGAMFLTCHAFAQLRIIGNLNFMSPYRHELTHGVLCVVGMVVVAAWSLRQGGHWRGAAWVLGALTTACLALKPECLLAAIVLTGTWVVLAVAADGEGGPAKWRQLLLDVTAAAVSGYAVIVILAVVLGYPLSLAVKMPVMHLGVFGGGAVNASEFVGMVTGTRNLGENVRRMLVSFLVQALFLGLLGGMAWSWKQRRWSVVCAVLYVGGLVWWFSGANAVFYFWRGLPLLVLVAAVVVVWRLWRAKRGGGPVSPTLGMALVVLMPGGVLLLKIAFNVTIGHYGFALTPLALAAYVLVITAVLPEELPSLRPAWLLAGMALLLACTAQYAVRMTRQCATAKTVEIGEGQDRVKMWPAGTAQGQLGRAVYDYLRPRVQAGETLVAVPEGTMLNYLLRAPDPTPFTHYNPFQLSAYGGEEAVLAMLQGKPPDYFVYIGNSCEEYGFARFGVKGYGDKIMAWVIKSYPEPQVFKCRIQGQEEVYGLIFAHPKQPQEAPPGLPE